MVRLYRTFCPSSAWFKHIEPLHYRDSKVWGSLSQEVGMVRLYRTFCPSSAWFKHIEPLHYRDSKVWRVLTHVFGEVRPYRNFSINSVKGETRCGRCLCTNSGWFKHIEPHRTYTNHQHRDTKVCRGLSHEFGVVRLYRTFSIYIVTGETRRAGCSCNRSGCFKNSEPHRTYSKPHHHRDSKV